MNRRFPSSLPGWEVIPEPPPSSEASSEDELQSISQTQPISSLRGGDSASKRRFNGLGHSLPKSKKQRLGQSGSGNDSISTGGQGGARVPSSTQPVASSSLSSTNVPKRVQLRKPTVANYYKRPAMPSSSVPSSSKLTIDTSTSKLVSTKEHVSKQISNSAPTPSRSDRRTHGDESEEDVVVLPFSSTNFTAVPAPGGKGKAKAKETSYNPVEQARPRSQLSLNSKGKTRGDSESSSEDIIGMRFGQLQRRESGKAQTENWSGGNKKPISTSKDKGLKGEGRFSGPHTASERVTTKPIKRSKAEKERRKSLGDTFSISSGAESNRGTAKAARMLSSVVRPRSNDVIELSSSEETKRPEVIEISDGDTPPPATPRKRKSSAKKSEASAFIDLTKDGSEDVGDEAPTTIPVAQRDQSVQEQTTFRNPVTDEEAGDANIDFEDVPGLDMIRVEGLRKDFVPEDVDDRDNANRSDLAPSTSTSMIDDATTESHSTAAHLKDIDGSDASSMVVDMDNSRSARGTTSLSVKQQSVSPKKESLFATQSASVSTPHPGPHSPLSSPKKEPPSSPQKISPSKPKLEYNHDPSSENSSPRSSSSPSGSPSQRPPAFVTPSPDPAERQEQESSPSPSQPESSPATLDLDHNTQGTPLPQSTSTAGAPEPSLEPHITDSVNVSARLSSDLHPTGTKLVTVQEQPTETALVAQQQASPNKGKHKRGSTVWWSESDERQEMRAGKTPELSQPLRSDTHANKTGVRNSRAKIFTARKSTGAAAPRLPRQLPKTSPPSSPTSSSAYISSLAQAFDDAGRANARDFQEQPREGKKQGQRSKDTLIEQPNSVEPKCDPMALDMMDSSTKAPLRPVTDTDVNSLVAVISSSFSTSDTGLISSTLLPIIASEDKILQAKARWHAIPLCAPNGIVETTLTSTSTNNDDNRTSVAALASSQEKHSSPKIDMPALSDRPIKSTSPELQEVIDLTTLLESSDDDDEGTSYGRDLELALNSCPYGPPEGKGQALMDTDEQQESHNSHAWSKPSSPSEQLSSELASALRMDGPRASPAVEEEEHWLEYLDEKAPEPSDSMSRGGESPALVYPEGSDNGIEALVDDGVVEQNRSPPTPAPSTNIPEVPISEEELSGQPLRSRSASSSASVVLRRSARNSRPSSQMSLTSTNTDFLNLSPQQTEVQEQLSFGGLAVLTWNSFRSDLNNFQPKCYWSVDLPHAFHDHVNWLSEDHRNNDRMRHIMESIMIENTSEEPHAPPISIVNKVDSIPTPPWEFYYTNKMWHSPNVPAPSVKHLGSCGCIGKCRPDTCACAKRQKEYTEKYVSTGFVYDKHRCLVQGGIPIFECNSLCRCDDDCMNRVVQHGRKAEVSLFKTLNKGWGVVNGPKKIRQGQFIGVYSGEYLTWDEAESRGRVYNKFGRTYLFDCDPWILVGGARFTIDAYHAGNFTRFLNHSCDPNARFGYVYIDEDNIYKPLLCVFAHRDIAPEEEITFSYVGDPDVGEDTVDDESPVKKKAKSKASRSKRVNSDNVYSECFCGMKNCTGNLFN
ncbi:hypothetical protein E1B28_005895 [Marasmius oreades]|uniref:Uncharacterized protein n=1 Tax=Marasmius oreades TaxID=181124 RepID=A0A9P7S4R7_9AGAR|nr:uncharacterized protein E1B28_005895 [Marasmius oreades]KAG7095110.1 hypothetical protein E1B28_005895 [Marasmius oreades]